MKATAADVDAPEPLYDLGVLFVHGIGQSAEGETLVRFGEPLRAAIEQLAAPASATAVAGPQAEVTSAWLSGPAGERPACAELRIEGCGATPARGAPAAVPPTSSRWLLAEAWWAEKFPTPTYAEIVSWSLGVLPATLVAHFDRRFRRIAFAMVRGLRGELSATVALLAFGA